MKQQTDWLDSIKLLRRYQSLHVGGQAIILASELLNTAIHQEIDKLGKGSLPKRLAQATVFYLEKMVNLHTEPVPEDVAVYHKRHLFLLMSKRQKFWFVMSFLYPYPDDAETLALPNYLHFLYFPLRPFLWAWRKTRKHALQLEEAE